MPAPARGPDRTFTLGGDGWVLERFGRDLAILRTGVTPPSGAAGLLVVACEGTERRWRLSFPTSVRASAPTSDTILLRPSGSPGRRERALLGRAQISEGRVLTLAENRSSNDGFVPAFVRLLTARPDRFDLLMREVDAAIRHRLFGPGTPASVFTPIVRATDLIAFEDFLSTCLGSSKR